MTTETKAFEDRQAVRTLFANLRVGGFLTQEGVACCGSCAAFECEMEAEAAQPFAFYHQQDEESFKELHADDGRGDVLERTLYIGFGIGRAKELDEDAWQAAVLKAGEEVALEAMAVGFKVDWNRTTARRVGLMAD